MNLLTNILGGFSEWQNIKIVLGNTVSFFFQTGVFVKLNKARKYYCSVHGDICLIYSGNALPDIKRVKFIALTGLNFVLAHNYTSKY